MKIGVIGDIHGHVVWKEFITDTTIDKWVFMGDYFDSRDKTLTALSQIYNFNDILAFKKANMDKVILLTGNHDFHYIRGVNETYSGYQHFSSTGMTQVVEKAINENLMQMAYLNDGFLFTHAGLTKTWCRNIMEYNEDTIDDKFINNINELLVYKPRVFCFNVGPNYDVYGDDVTQGPIWVRPNSLVNDMIEGVTCVVGHTSVEDIDIQLNNKIILVDCLNYTNNFLVIEDGKPKKAF